MLLRRRTTRISSKPIEVGQGFEHVDAGALAVLRWLKDNGVEFVLVGAVAEALRGGSKRPGPVAIVPAPYRRNLARLAQALNDAGATLRVDGVGPGGGPDTTATTLTPEKLARPQRWTLRCGSHDIDVEYSARAGQDAKARLPIYQELLYEASRLQPGPGLAFEVASPEDIEHYAHVHRTGKAPEMRISRLEAEPSRPASRQR
jgi:hypothetical protein